VAAFLVNKTANTVQKLSPVLAGGAQSLGNPTVSFLTLPTGVPALVFTCFVFGANNGTTPLGGHMFVYPPRVIEKAVKTRGLLRLFGRVGRTRAKCAEDRMTPGIKEL
jgi:hypothetical protein